MKTAGMMMLALTLALGMSPAGGAEEGKTEAKPVAVEEKKAPEGKTPDIEKGGTVRVSIETSKGTIVTELDREKAPLSVENFLTYAREGYYEGTVFHRVISGFMIQGGGMTSDLRPKGGGHPPIKNEAKNGLKNQRGTLAMARTNDLHSATSQFFINLMDNGFLDHKDITAQGYGYAVFGRVVQGLEVVDAIGAVKTGKKMMFSDVPVEPVTIKKVTVME